jgi:CheY-like chemotaxis protein
MIKTGLIYLVDDDPLISTLIIKRLTSNGHRVVHFESGEGCIDSLHENPDIVILEYQFIKEPRGYLNGIEIYDKIRELKPGIPVIILSGQERGELVLELARKGIDDYVIKDINLLDNLHSSIVEIMSGKK